jgi:TorA maturation chaperone TorD
MNPNATDVAPLLAQRELWLLAATAFVDPYHSDRFQVLMDPVFRRRTCDAASLLAEEQPVADLGPGERDPAGLSPARLFAALDAQYESLETAYRQLFGLTAVSQQCPPCEVEYETNTDVAYRSQRLADVAAFYNGFGLRVSARAGERLDHITVEAEFLYLLLAKEAAALEKGNQEGTEICRDARQKFFREHVGWWLPAFARVLSHVASPGYYQELAGFVSGLSALERVSLGLPPFPARVIPKPSGEDLQAACLSCPDGQPEA